MCKLVKPVSDFYLNGQRPRSSCKVCDLKKRAEKVPEERTRVRAYNKRYYAAKKAGVPLPRPAPTPVGTKRCTGCKEILPFASFNKFKGTSDGYAPKCKTCKAAAWKELGVVGRPPVVDATCRICEKTLPASEFQPYQGNLSGLSSSCKSCEKIRMHDGYMANREERIAQTRAYAANLPDEKRKRRNDLANARRRANPEKRLEDNRRRRARKLGSNEPGVTAAEWREVLEYHDYRCAYCLEKHEKLSMDHIIALTRGGEHSPDNVVPACASCNSTKYAHPIFMMATRITR
jgi:5-methylcytosine-specific restriction endonuclease McrA